jgi:hypothetical protein
MAIDLSKIKSRLNSLSNTNNKTQLIWKPKPGKQTIRIVPYKYQPDTPFIELKFHYGINNKTYLSPDSFNRPDPIVEFSNRLKKTGSKEDWQTGRKMEPKMRTFAPVIVRGEEHEGVKFWGFGKQVYQEILSVMADPDYGDITDLASGRDIVVEFRTAEESGKNYPETSIRVKPNATPAVDPKDGKMLEALKNQTDILDLFPEPKYEELKEVMNAWLNPEEAPAETVSNAVVDDDDTQPVAAAAVQAAAPKATSKSPTATAAKTNTDDLTKAFDNLFNG